MARSMGDVVRPCQQGRSTCQVNWHYYTSMPLYKLTVSYDGSRFNGFQRQITNASMTTRMLAEPSTTRPLSRERPPKRPHWESNGRKKGVPQTIQDCLEDAIGSWTEQSVDQIQLRFAGRTDKGVHSRGQVVAVTLPDNLSVADWEIQNSINSRLPIDISVRHVQQCSNHTFDPRRDVVMKQYSYSIRYRRKVCDSNNLPLHICDAGPNTFRNALDPPTLWVCPWSLDDSRMSALCKFLQGQHDFEAFVHKKERTKQSHDILLSSMVYEMQHETAEDAPVVTARFVLEARGFRRNMVRNLVGFCVDVCRGRDDFAGFDLDKLWAGEPEVADKICCAPAAGLCLEWVKYDGKELSER